MSARIKLKYQTMNNKNNKYKNQKQNKQKYIINRQR